NEDYKIVNHKSIAYNPSRANTGSLSINLTKTKLAVSKMYVTFKVIDERFLPEFVYLCIKSQEGIQSIKDRSFGSVRQSLRFDDLCTISIPFILIEEQQKIVDSVNKKYKQFVKYKEELDQFNLKDDLK
ncbi:MAG: restriction endonuclease subunit S, partial [Solirubrobacteraceae bacterium]